MGGLQTLSIPNMRSDIFGLDFKRGDSRLYTQHEVRHIWFGFYTWGSPDSIPNMRSDIFGLDFTRGGLQTLYPT